MVKSDRQATLIFDENSNSYNIDSDSRNSNWLAELRQRKTKESRMGRSKLTVDTGAINDAITDFLIKVVREPLIHFSEADLQQLLVEELRKIDTLSANYPTKVRRGQNSKSVYQTSLIHREYGGGQGSRIDVVIFDQHDVNEIDDINLTKGKKYLKPLFAFELGTEKTSDTKGHFDNDIKKLGKSKETGYLIHIYRDKTKAKSGSQSRKKTEENIKSGFKEVFAQYRADPKIKILAVLLRIYRHQTRILGKCEICCSGKWKKININNEDKLREEILEQLR